MTLETRIGAAKRRRQLSLTARAGQETAAEYAVASLVAGVLCAIASANHQVELQRKCSRFDSLS